MQRISQIPNNRLRHLLYGQSVLRDLQEKFLSQYQEELKVKPDQLLLLKIMVMEEEIGTVAEIQKEKSENSLHTEIKETVDEENIIKTLLEEDQGSVKYLLGIGILSGTALVIGLLVRKKRNKYD